MFRLFYFFFMENLDVGKDFQETVSSATWKEMVAYYLCEKCACLPSESQAVQYKVPFAR